MLIIAHPKPRCTNLDVLFLCFPRKLLQVIALDPMHVLDLPLQFTLPSEYDELCPKAVSYRQHLAHHSLLTFPALQVASHNHLNSGSECCQTDLGISAQLRRATCASYPMCFLTQVLIFKLIVVQEVSVVKLAPSSSHSFVEQSAYCVPCVSRP